MFEHTSAVLRVCSACRKPIGPSTIMLSLHGRDYHPMCLDSGPTIDDLNVKLAAAEAEIARLTRERDEARAAALANVRHEIETAELTQSTARYLDPKIAFSMAKSFLLRRIDALAGERRDGAERGEAAS